MEIETKYNLNKSQYLALLRKFNHLTFLKYKNTYYVNEKGDKLRYNGETYNFKSRVSGKRRKEFEAENKYNLSNIVKDGVNLELWKSFLECTNMFENNQISMEISTVRYVKTVDDTLITLDKFSNEHGVVRYEIEFELLNGATEFDYNLIDEYVSKDMSDNRDKYTKLKEK